eukprot:scaffold302642_cov28-Tisochrysis_lutea.AAC.1
MAREEGCGSLLTLHACHLTHLRPLAAAAVSEAHRRRGCGKARCERTPRQLDRAGTRGGSATLTAQAAGFARRTRGTADVLRRNRPTKELFSC